MNPKKESHNFLHSLCYYPKVTFESQRQGEEVILVLRKHPLTQLYWIINTVFLVIILVFVDFFFSPYITPNEMFVLNAFAAVFIFSYAWLNFLLWVFNVGIVSTERIVDIDFYNILYKEVTAANNEKVSDVTAKIGGFFGSIFQYGDVFVKTEGFEQEIEFEDVPRPTEVADLINELIRDTDNG